MKKLTKSEVLAAIRNAISTSERFGNSWVEVFLPGWEGYRLQASRGRAYSVQQHPSLFIKVRNHQTRCIVWSTSAAYLSSLAGDIVRCHKETGWSGPVRSELLPFPFVPFVSETPDAG